MNTKREERYRQAIKKRIDEEREKDPLLGLRSAHPSALPKDIPRNTKLNYAPKDALHTSLRKQDYYDP